MSWFLVYNVCLDYLIWRIMFAMLRFVFYLVNFVCVRAF